MNSEASWSAEPFNMADVPQQGPESNSFLRLLPGDAARPIRTSMLMNSFDWNAFDYYYKLETLIADDRNASAGGLVESLHC